MTPSCRHCEFLLCRFDALFVVPVFQAFWIAFSVLSGMVTFGEYEQVFSADRVFNAIFFPFGLLVSISGVWFLSQRGMLTCATSHTTSPACVSSHDIT